MSKESHSFSVSIACKIGIEGAIVLQHLIFLQRSGVEGWAKKSNKAMSETYPYLTPKKIRGVLDRLERDGYITSAIKNERPEDRTKSYFVTKEGHNLYGTGPFDQKANGVAERANDNVPKGQMHNSYSIIFSSSYAQGFEEDYRVKEAFTLSRKIPAVKYDSYLRAWDKEIAATGEEYAKHSEAVKHFLNYSATKYRIEVQETEKKARAAAPHQTPAVGMRKSVPVYDANGLVTQ